MSAPVVQRVSYSDALAKTFTNSNNCFRLNSLLKNLLSCTQYFFEEGVFAHGALSSRAKMLQSAMTVANIPKMVVDATDLRKAVGKWREPIGKDQKGQWQPLLKLVYTVSELFQSIVTSLTKFIFLQPDILPGLPRALKVASMTNSYIDLFNNATKYLEADKGIKNETKSGGQPNEQSAVNLKKYFVRTIASSVSLCSSIVPLPPYAKNAMSAAALVMKLGAEVYGNTIE